MVVSPVFSAKVKRLVHIQFGSFQEWQLDSITVGTLALNFQDFY